MIHSEPPFDHESAFSHYLALLALGMEDEVREKLQSAVAVSGGDFRHAPPKTFGRMETKRTADHKDDPAPKGASNVDVLRGGATYEATDLPNGYTAVAEAFGGCRRVKNGFMNDRDTSMDVNFGYRAVLCNYLHTSKRTFRQIAKLKSTQEKWEQYVDSFGTSEQAEVDDGIQFSRTEIQKLLTYISEDDNVASLAVECQFMTPFYRDNVRKMSHAFFKIHRAETPKDLWLDCIDARVYNAPTLLDPLLTGKTMNEKYTVFGSHLDNPNSTRTLFTNPNQSLTKKKMSKRNSDGVIFAAKLNQGVNEIAKITRCKRNSDGVDFVAKTSTTNDKDLRGMILREASMLRCLQYPENAAAIIDVVDLFSNDEETTLVYPYAEGGNLYDLLKRVSQFTTKDARAITHAVLKALNQCHDKGIVHRNLKPENILIQPPIGEVSRRQDIRLKDNSRGLQEDDVLITGFILSQAVTDDKHSLGANLSGTPEYMAPEVMMSNDKSSYGLKADLWALGILLYELIHGLHPFYDANTEIMYDNILNDECKVEFPSHYDSAAKDLTEKLLKREASERIDAKEALAHPFFSYGYEV
jgi:hypothetical protein